MTKSSEMRQESLFDPSDVGILLTPPSKPKDYSETAVKRAVHQDLNAVLDGEIFIGSETEIPSAYEELTGNKITH